MQPVSLLPRRRKVAICGFAKPHRMEAPYGDPDWEIWSVNDAWGFLPPDTATRMFELHKPWIYEWELRRAKGHLDWLRAFAEAGGIVYLLDPRADMPNAVTFPLAPVMANIGAFGQYLTSSIAYMLALAIAEGFETIGVYGVDMAAESEYSDQRPACEFLIGVAQGRGIEVLLPAECKLMKGPMYGRGYLNPGGERITTNQLQTRLKDLQKGEQQAIAVCDNNLSIINQIKGALAANRELIGLNPEAAPLYKARIDNLDEQQKQAQMGWAQCMEQLNLIRGAISETLRWIGITPEGGDPRYLPAVETAALPGPAEPGYHVCGDGCDTPADHRNGHAREALAVGVPRD